MNMWGLEGWALCDITTLSQRWSSLRAPDSPGTWSAAFAPPTPTLPPFLPSLPPSLTSFGTPPRLMEGISSCLLPVWADRCGQTGRMCESVKRSARSRASDLQRKPSCFHWADGQWMAKCSTDARTVQRSLGMSRGIFHPNFGSITKLFQNIFTL